jgi:4-hydroxyproline epimerase
MLVERLARERRQMNSSPGRRIEFVDSHTEGEPTRVIVSGGPDLGAGTVAEQLKRLRQQDWFRRCVILEPRGWEALVAAVLCSPNDQDCAAGVIFVNNAGYLGMCGHGAIGVAVTLHYLGRIGLGKHRLETPVGIVEVNLKTANHVEIENVPSYRLQRNVNVDVAGVGNVLGDVAWGGNWFFLVEQSPVELRTENLAALADVSRRIRKALRDQGITGQDGAEIDHIELIGPGQSAGSDSRNYVFCPGDAYDRSPCGTGTSAKIACLAADEKLKPGERWVQESIIGTKFEASYRIGDDQSIIPTISGHAHICAQGILIRDDNDPLRDGIANQ